MKPLIIATRRSRLALWQAEHVKARLEGLHPGLTVHLLALSTRGDELLDARLDEAGGKGLFVKELENALADARADLAVHSMKDMPAGLPPGFTLSAITAREDPRDALVSDRYDSSSLRRASQISARSPGLDIRLLRGNVDTRLAKLDRGEYDAIVLAVAGLVRLGLESRIRSKLAVEEMLPAPGQGALGIESLASRAEVSRLLAPLADVATSLCVRAERAVSDDLGGSCTIPLGAFAEVTGTALRLRALLATPDGKRILRSECSGPADQPESLGRRAAGELRAQGAVEILAALAR
jgi:hydroxymethylbilane synthase